MTRFVFRRSSPSPIVSRMLSSRKGLVAALTLIGAMVQTARADAADCSTQPKPVYLSASGNHKALLKQASLVLQQQVDPVTLVFQQYVSCVALDQVMNGTKATASAIYWDSTGTEVACQLPLDGVVPDAGMSDVFASTCGVTLPNTLKDFIGPNQVMTFVTSPGSSETSISAEAAYVVFGFGGASHPLAPWTDPSYLYIRGNTAGTKLLMGLGIGLDVGKWKGDPKNGAGDVLTAVSGSLNPAATLGIITTELADAYRTPVDGKQIKTLAYQHKGQSCGYYPDSSSSSFDKRNVREGRYPLWGPFHVVTKVSEAGEPSNALVSRFVNVLTRKGLGEPEKKSMTDAEIAAHAVPVCAMKVSRSVEMETPKAFTPDEPCGCYFDSKTGGSVDRCTVCADDGGCSGATPHCRFGFCEVK